MNWKRFVAECQELKSWLVEQEVSDPERCILRGLVALFSGETSPERIMAEAMNPAGITEAIGAAGPLPAVPELPDNIHELVARWQCTLTPDPWLLGELYEKLAAGRRVQGLFYTTPDIIDFIMGHTVETADVVGNPFLKVLDPACGCGYFLLKAYDVLWRKFTQHRSQLTWRYPELDWSDDGIHRHIVSYNLWGADIDSLAAEITSAGLLLKRSGTAGEVPAPNILVCDSLRRPSDEAPGADRAFWTAGYDYVVGNPPYLSFGLRGTRRLDPDYEAYLRQAFSASAEYKLSYYVLFMERGIEMLVEGGKLGFIVPDSFLLGRYYSKIRRYIMEHTTIELIAHIALPVFKNATVGMSAICILTKASDPEVRAGHEVTVCQAESKEDLKRGAPGCSYGQQYFATLPHNRFRLFSDLTVKNLIDKIDNSSENLVNFASGHSGIRSMSRQSDIVATAPAGETWRPGLISGSQVQRYGLTYEGHWLNIDPLLLYKGGWDPARVSQRKILIRQTGYTLTACIDDNGYYHLNNLHSFILRSPVVNLDYLLMLLNSRLFSFYYHAVTMEYGRTMAQTDIDTLELLPIRLHDEANAQAPELVRIVTGLRKRQLAGEAGVNAKITAMDDLCNQLAYRIYQLTEAEIACIEQYEARLAARHRNSHRLRRNSL
ncbi:MAG TPA: N-6 DNA methylase [Selenomonadales bacterium]|nr:N-6 DNA methylase [Selenomonadales bacterium]